MAEGIFRRLTRGQEAYEISSAGVSAMDGFGASYETIEVMREFGEDVSSHRRRRITPEMIRQADHIIVMEAMHRDYILNIAPDARNKIEVLGEIGIPDPIGGSREVYRQTLARIEQALRALMEDRLK